MPDSGPGFLASHGRDPLLACQGGSSTLSLSSSLSLTASPSKITSVTTGGVTERESGRVTHLSWASWPSHETLDGVTGSLKGGGDP